MSNAFGSIAEMEQNFSAIDGTTLTLWSLTVGHCTLIFAVTGIQGEEPYISFGRPEYINCPHTMHHVHLRKATFEETEELRHKLAPQRGRWLEQKDHLIILCDEGKAEIWARAANLRWTNPPSTTYLDEISASIWYGYPTLDEL